MTSCQPSHARDAVTKVLENTHDTLKWSWQITMAFALTDAVTRCHEALVRLVHAAPGQAAPTDFMSVACFTLGFLPAFVRLFYGDNRYLDLHYGELKRRWAHQPDSATEQCDAIAFLVDRHPPRRMFGDTMLLLTHGMLFVFMARSINDAIDYIAFHLLMLATNTIWLVIVLLMNRRSRDESTATGHNSLVGTRRVISESPRRDTPVFFWIVNNTVFVLIVLTIALSSRAFVGVCSIDTWRWCVLGLFLINSMLDLWFIRDFYWPRLDALYRDVLHAADDF